MRKALLVLVLAAVSLSGCASEASDQGATKRVTLLAEKSLCLADTGSARIHFRITVRNEGELDDEVDVTPWRRYSDNTVNDSGADELGLDVPAGETVTFRAEFGYNAEEHRLVECGVRFDGADEPTLFTVVG